GRLGDGAVVMAFPPAVDSLIAAALDEDLGRGDATSEALVDADLRAAGELLAKQELVLSGLDVALAVFARGSGGIQARPLGEPGTLVQPGQSVMTVAGSARGLLGAERTALNFVQHLSGVATLTRAYVDQVAGTKARVVDTRKTLPGFRWLDKRAVRDGGGHNH